MGCQCTQRFGPAHDVVTIFKAALQRHHAARRIPSPLEGWNERESLMERWGPLYQWAL